MDAVTNNLNRKGNASAIYDGVGEINSCIGKQRGRAGKGSMGKIDYIGLKRGIIDRI